MSIGSRLKEARIDKHLTQGELANLIGVTKGAIANYENQVSVPRTEILVKLMSALGCDANYLYQDDAPANEPDISLEELKHLKKYRELDPHGKEMVNLVLDKEYERSRIVPAAAEESPRWKAFVGIPVAARGGVKLADETEAKWLANIYDKLLEPKEKGDLFAGGETDKTVLGDPD